VDYPAFVVGNDPVMPKELDTFHEAKEQIALIATSGLRAISLACKLGNKENTPKIILVDNSMQVIEFWREMKKFIGYLLL
jgi:CheY-like chemotaxis protein